LHRAATNRRLDIFEAISCKNQNHVPSFLKSRITTALQRRQLAKKEGMRLRRFAHTRWDEVGIFIWNARNPLKSPDSDE
jgi:hypothetical protein